MCFIVISCSGMKSSDPVFPRQKPLQQASKARKTQYHPSSKQPQSLSKKKKISPVGINQQSSSHLRTRRKPEEQEHDHSFATTGDCGSSQAGTSIFSDMVTPGQSVRAGKHSVSSEQGVQQDSVLSKYIERFRHGRPQSREERQHMASTFDEEPVPFWWMSSLSPSLKPTKSTVQDVIQPLKDDHRPITSSPVHSQHDRSLSPCRGSQSMMSDTPSGEFDDTEILHLQERANRLLLRDDYTVNDRSFHVSPEGLGCSDFSSPPSVDEPVRRPFVPDVTTSANAKASSDSIYAFTSPKSSVIPPLVLPTRPQEDILFQWRLRRKIEQARESSQQHSGPHGAIFNGQFPSSCQTFAEEKAYKFGVSGITQPTEVLEKAKHPQIAAPMTETKEAPGSYASSSIPAPTPALFSDCAVSGIPASQPQTIAQVPAHMHFLCDILPCPIQASHTSEKQILLQKMDEIQTNVIHKKSQVTENLMKTANDAPVCGRVPVHPQALSAPIKGEETYQHRGTERKKKEKSQTREMQKDDEKASISCRKQKKPTRSSNQKVWQREFSSESCAVDHAPPPSPVHSALGQVISEVLFPTKDSSPEQRTPVSSASFHTFSTLPESSVPPCDNQPSMEVISQLLQEAEDSDGKEFEEDPLLKVLRKQRKWVKEQIREVDSLMNDFLDKQQDTRPLATLT
ncbi:proline and serine-rich protein 3 [Halichoeres trimaculatus]|uniref:proline and serine-rich protein 3 n=1 Tax=Halichoeres trimaculatus TaxID=147232 RepID=UPI003D9E8BFC